MVDHSIVLECWQQTFGISDTALCWFQSYLSSRTQYVRRGTTNHQSLTSSAACHKDPSLARSFTSCIYGRSLTSNRLRLVDADACSTYHVAMLRCATSDPSLCTVGHTPDASGRTGALPAGLWKRRAAGRPSSLPDALLQSVLNVAAQMIYRLRTRDHITDALISLHWLRVPERIQYKLAILAYRVLHGDYHATLVC